MKLLVLGGGESGAGAAMLGKKLGYDVFLSDRGVLKEKYKNVLIKAGIKWEEGAHSGDFLQGTELVIKSPGIPSETAIVLDLKKAGAEVISEIEFAARHTKGKIIAITGTNGKTTTTLLTHHMFAKAGKDVIAAGNVGKSFAGLLAERDRDIWVLEVSSFQLDDIVSFKPDVAILLNITSDHLDRYGYEMQNYADAKFAIARNLTEADHFIYSDDDEVILKNLKEKNIKAQLHPISTYHPVENGAYITENELIINLTNNPYKMSIHDLALQGRHNVYNSMAASVSARLFDLRKEVVRDSLSDYENIEHRLEFVAEIHGIKFINDSKATNVNGVWYALENYSEKIVWIVGGVDKGNDYSILEALVREKVKAIICLGTDNKKLMDYFGPMVENIAEAHTATEAVNLGYAFAKKNDVVLLSPACASFDLFENYEDRGQQFKRAVRAL
ncbi:UDP-N-acetylmuramoyl-L-alanine--D-glutamate ligase [Cryomorpha ignava]|uniref:UDP-N-acetylmuramoylalanine--D-glutamate ligase n=1 Tax=Cryomorpha ignava TaxID=101383 RepID=A0A7K3WQD9_9FLAO|nr:UDP-N-acetylmuramoyl-L-alanine--D-glutamate ligase [Cryomorpha ignava]NEN22975.1 UDP-N-acetylmuramoyl-L-alanine--D-glutamate ligase [Cryomorpha ignava]